MRHLEISILGTRSQPGVQWCSSWCGVGIDLKRRIGLDWNRSELREGEKSMSPCMLTRNGFLMTLAEPTKLRTVDDTRRHYNAFVERRAQQDPATDTSKVSVAYESVSICTLKAAAESRSKSLRRCVGCADRIVPIGSCKPC